MKVTLGDLLILIDAGYAIAHISGYLRRLGCKYTHNQILDAVNRINSEIANIGVKVDGSETGDSSPKRPEHEKR